LEVQSNSLGGVLACAGLGASGKADEDAGEESDGFCGACDAGVGEGCWPVGCGHAVTGIGCGIPASVPRRGDSSAVCGDRAG